MPNMERVSAFAAGTTDVYTSSIYAEGVSADLFSLSGGEITSTVDALDPDSSALLFLDALITGGYGEFTSVNAGYGAVWAWADYGYFRVIDGHVIFSGEDNALFFDTDRVLVPYVTDRIYASTSASGAGKFIWDPALGTLAGNSLGDSAYDYVEMIGDGEFRRCRRGMRTACGCGRESAWRAAGCGIGDLLA